MIDKAGCKIAEYAGDDHHTWQKQPEALLAYGVEPWSIGLQAHDDGHMPQVDPVLIPGYEIQRTQESEIHFQHGGEYLTFAYKIYRVIRKPGIMEIADNREAADNSENNGCNGSYELVFPDCFIKERKNRDTYTILGIQR